MTLRKAFIISVSSFKDIFRVAMIPFWKVMLYCLFLAGLLAIPMVVSVANTAATLKTNAQTIAKKLPDFEVKDGQLESDSEGGIFMKEHLIVTFDPASKRTEDDVIHDTANSENISIGLLKDSVLFALPTNALTESFFDAGHLKMSYDDANLEGMNNATLSETLNFRIPIIVYVVLFLIAIYPVMFNFLLNILFIAIFAHLYTRIYKLTLRFAITVRYVIFSSTVSVLAITVLNLLGVQFNQLFLMVILTMIVFQRGISIMTHPKIPDNIDTDKYLKKK